ncbi:hypothetical protein EV182_005896, partial [Spiromyces aspiralis]
LNAYLYDYLRKRGFKNTAASFITECPTLPLNDPTPDDPVGNIYSSSSGSKKSLSNDSSCQRILPSVRLPYDASSPGQIYLCNWWNAYWDIYQATSQTAHGPPPSNVTRAYVQMIQ